MRSLVRYSALRLLSRADCWHSKTRERGDRRAAETKIHWHFQVSETLQVAARDNKLELVTAYCSYVETTTMASRHVQRQLERARCHK